MAFASLGLSPELTRAVAAKGYDAPTPIQARAIPAILAGRDVLASAQTGTGKTAGFVLPMLERLAAMPRLDAPRALILTPTRELAAQVAESAREYGQHLNLRTFVIFGGVSERPQISALRRGIDILVATPGRLLDLVNQRAADLSAVEFFVLDEADRMLDMGFIHDIKRVIKVLPQKRQNLLFSATYNDDIRRLATGLLRNPETIEVAPRNTAAERVEQISYRLPQNHKRHLLVHLIKSNNWEQVLIFTRMKHGANRLSEQLERAGIKAAAIHGNKSQNARVRALEGFKAGEITALVATEVAARGLDIKELPHVVNYELPNVPEDYVHRIGRTGRAGAAGHAVSLVAPDEGGYLRDIERVVGRSIPTQPLPAFEIVESAHAESSDRGREGSHSPRQQQGRSRNGNGHGNGGGQRRPAHGGQESRSDAGGQRAANGAGRGQQQRSGNGPARPQGQAPRAAVPRRDHRDAQPQRSGDVDGNRAPARDGHAPVTRTRDDRGTRFGRF